MACSSDIDTPAIGSPQTIADNHPYTYSIASSASSSSSSVFSVDAASSRSSDTPSSTTFNVTWGSDNENEGSYPDNRRFSQESILCSSQPSICLRSDTACHIRSESKPPCEPVSLESRQHPRRTQRLIEASIKNGNSVISHVRPPPALVRQCERKGNFVDSLVDTTTQMIETIWPLSVLSCPRDSTIGGRDQTLIGLRTFVQEVLRRSKTSYSTLQVALYYLVLIQSLVPKHDFTMEQFVDSQSCRAMQCGRRMFLAALILASKYLQDRNFSARAWSKISGLKTQEINTNEMAFLSAISWKLHIPEPLFNRWTDIVLKYSLSSSLSMHSRTPSNLAASAKLWKSLIPRLTANLDRFDFGVATISDDPGYSSPKVLAPRPSSTIPAQLTPPPFSESSEQTPTNPYEAPKVLEPTSLKCDNEPTLPPLPRLGPLPTPTMTPHVGTFNTPAASALGFCSGRPSMSVAMAQVQTSSLARSTLDSLSCWKPAHVESFPISARRSSLAPSNSTLSSPESMVSDVSSRSSRSSSISSVASACALPRPKLAVQATRRCANMQLSSLKENNRPFLQASPSEDSIWEPLKLSLDGIPTTEGDCYFARPSLPLPKAHPEGFCDSASCNSTSTHEAAAALRDLALGHHFVFPHPSGLSNSRKRENPAPNDLSTMAPFSAYDKHQETLYPCAKSRKRERQTSTDLSVQDCVRESIAPRFVGETTNGQICSRDDGTVLPDPILANSFLLPKKDKAALNPCDELKNVPTIANIARKRPCGAIKSKWDTKHLTRFAREYAAPGMWEGVI